MNNNLEELMKYYHEKDMYKKAYWWTSPSNAKARRNYEKKHSTTFTSLGTTFRRTVRCSCKNIYIDHSHTKAEIKKILRKNFDKIITTTTAKNAKTTIDIIDTIKSKAFFSKKNKEKVKPILTAILITEKNTETRNTCKKIMNTYIITKKEEKNDE